MRGFTQEDSCGLRITGNSHKRDEQLVYKVWRGFIRGAKFQENLSVIYCPPKTEGRELVTKSGYKALNEYVGHHCPQAAIFSAQPPLFMHGVSLWIQFVTLSYTLFMWDLISSDYKGS